MKNIVDEPGEISRCDSNDPPRARSRQAPAGDVVHLPAFFPKFRMPSTFSSIVLRTTSKASF